ncbi:MAG TPA: SMP-30/gluconolactonase/LRE family protein [Anaerolineales bacterium]|nr:SMP-30/gluconolactonase/LRE family protein [Anaerolineales bacterium]HNN14042.1 SMP-30/gluconolactonase/LRE family protein [Anaerolineales bacterium]
MKVELLLDARATLGEGPAWDEKTQTLYWLDILQKKIYAGVELLAGVDDFVGCLAPCRNGHLILGKRASFVDLDPVTSQQTVLSALSDSERVTNRVNDGKCDPAGRFIAGTMDMNETDPTGSVYSFDGSSARILFREVTISNGLAWSRDHKTFYYIDTPTREVRAFDYDPASGEIANPRAAIHVPESLGWPDGMTSDTDGNLWVALWGGAQVTCWNPNTGQLLEQIPVPALQTSSCVFGGRHRNELYITSARKQLSEADLKKYPLSGGLFKVVTKIEGMPTFEFNS